MNDVRLEFAEIHTPIYPNFLDVRRAAYHAGGCGFSFADGHAEIHRWQGPNLVAVPYTYGVVNNGQHVPSSVHDPDWSWLSQRAACHQ